MDLQTVCARMCVQTKEHVSNREQHKMSGNMTDTVCCVMCNDPELCTDCRELYISFTPFHVLIKMNYQDAWRFMVRGGDFIKRSSGCHAGTAASTQHKVKSDVIVEVYQRRGGSDSVFYIS